MTKPDIIAHRGARNEVPENTVESISTALSLDGLSGVEFDVELADGPCVLHQETMIPNSDFSALEDATPNYTSRDWVGAAKLSEIMALDAGSWFNSEFPHLRVPTLNNVFKCSWGDKTAYMELKDPTFRSEKDLERPQKLVQAVAPDIKNFKGSLQVISFNPEVLLEMAKEFPEVPRVLALWTEWQGKKQIKAISEAKRATASTISIADSMILAEPEWIKFIKDADLALHVYPTSPTRSEAAFKNWTAENRIPVWDRLLELNVDGIITDFPRELIAHIGS